MPKLDSYKVNSDRKKIGGKWKPMIMLILYAKPARFNKIKQLLPELSSTQLSKSIREMESDRLIEKNSEVYHLSKEGQKICGLMMEIKSILDSINC